MAYEQAVANRYKQQNVQENEEVKRTLKLVLNKLNKQEPLFTALDERIQRLEYSAQGATLKIKQKGILSSNLWHRMPMGSCNINNNCRQSLIQKKWMCASYLKHTSLRNPISRLGIIRYTIPYHSENTARRRIAVLFNEDIHHYKETKYEYDRAGIQDTAVGIKARNYSFL
jgi:hypothetical protein